jgi:competence protein ComEA
MFRRPSLRDDDVVAAAQRRLAALAQHHVPVRSAETPPAEDEGAEPMETVAVPAFADPASASGRHASARRAELGRWGLTAQQVTVAALLVLGLVVAVSWWALRSEPHSQPVMLSSQRSLPTPPTAGLSPSTVAVSAPTATEGGQTATSGSSRLVVDVAGRVRRPGIVELPQGSRIVDAIAAAGGARPGVRLTSLNLAQVLVDGEQIVVGIDVPVVGGATATDGSTPGSSTGSIAPVNLNTATAEELDTLPGIGPVTAQAILQWRTDNGPFTSVDDLLDVSGIGDATLSDIRPYVYV